MNSSGSNAPMSLKFGTVSIRFRLVDRNIVISEYAGSSSSSSLSSASFFFFCFWVNTFQAHYRPLWKNCTHCIFESIFLFFTCPLGKYSTLFFRSNLPKAFVCSVALTLPIRWLSLHNIETAALCKRWGGTVKSSRPNLSWSLSCSLISGMLKSGLCLL